MLQRLSRLLMQQLGDTSDPIEIPTSVDTGIIQRLVDCLLGIKEAPKNYKPIVIASKNQTHDAVILTTGGLDSTIAWFYAESKGYQNPKALYVDFGQEYAWKELNALDSIGIKAEVIEYRLKFSTWDHIIPARNMLLLTLASEYIDSRGDIWLSSVSGETPETGGDKSLEFYYLMQELFRLYENKRIRILTLKQYTKAQWIEWFMEKYPDLDKEEKIRILQNTISCFSKSDLHCGKCRACLRKWISFVNAGIPTEGMFAVHPYKGCNDLVQEYKQRIKEALDKQDFSYFSPERCKQTLKAFEMYEKGEIG